MVIGKYILIIVIFFNLIACGESSHNIEFIRTFDKTNLQLSDSIIVTIQLKNLENPNLHGFYYTEYIPDSLIVIPLSFKINDVFIDDFYFEIDSVNSLYENHLTYRWILEVPPNFSEENYLSFNSFLEIKYSLKALVKGDYFLNNYNWIGYYRDTQAAFGFSDLTDTTKISFSDDEVYFP